ncbi:Nucleoside triphosphate pyrophosphohydrolase/pyrophosphatase MazG [bioreactor metagenome]|uniref:Nucleoside triphosphate pyrophosphohydrolase/pyrophosphatase MazG n=1 Tax=bioreactor metagenome TaxID=1076179 RepID=A0A645JTY8_9ZZZZ
MFSVVNISRFVDCDAEEALTASTNKFIDRYKLVEKIAKERAIDMKQVQVAELDMLWNEAKDLLKR